MATLIQQRRDTAANWTATNPILADGEIGIEKVTKKFKIGDGVLAWNDLDYAATGTKPELPITASRNLLSSDQANILVNAGATDLTITILTEAVSGIQAGAVQQFFTSSTGKFLFAGVAITGVPATQAANTGFELRYRGGDVWVYEGAGGSSSLDSDHPFTYVYTNGVLTSSTDTVTGEVFNYFRNAVGQFTSITRTLNGVTKTKTFTYNADGTLFSVSLWV